MIEGNTGTTFCCKCGKKQETWEIFINGFYPACYNMTYPFPPYPTEYKYKCPQCNGEYNQTGWDNQNFCACCPFCGHLMRGIGYGYC